MLAKNSIKKRSPVDKKMRRFLHDLECLSMITYTDSRSEAMRLGRALREIRLNRKWSLKDFEIASGSKIKDVVLGSYERGARSISVSKLSIIAQTYEIPISALFRESPIAVFPIFDAQMIIDLRKLRETLQNHSSEIVKVLEKFTENIINLRKDWNGEVLSVRASDLTLISIMQRDKNQNVIEECRKLNLLITTRD